MQQIWQNEEKAELVMNCKDLRTQNTIQKTSLGIL